MKPSGLKKEGISSVQHHNKCDILSFAIPGVYVCCFCPPTDQLLVLSQVLRESWEPGSHLKNSSWQPLSSAELRQLGSLYGTVIQVYGMADFLYFSPICVLAFLYSNSYMAIVDCPTCSFNYDDQRWRSSNVSVILRSTVAFRFLHLRKH